MTPILHPQTGTHYAQVIPEAWGPFTDLHAVYSHYAERCPWLTVHGPWSVPAEIWDCPEAVVFAWTRLASAPAERKARIVAVYSEAIGPRDQMLPAHVAELQAATLNAQTKAWDAVCGHTPWMAEQLGALLGLPAYVLPVGWDEATMGAPHFSGPKTTDYLWYGSPAGKRTLVMPWLHQRLGSRLTDLSGAFGRLLLAHLDRSRAALYIAHSDVQSFSTWRIWQTLATSAALVMEPGDCWPLDPTRHAVPIPRLTWINAETVADELARILREVDLLAVARRAHEDVARQFTVERVINEYMVPLGPQIVRRA